MALINRGTPEEKEAARLAKEQQKREIAAAKEFERQANEREKVRQGFLRSPAGHARAAFERGEQVFQYSIDVQRTQAVVTPTVGVRNTSSTTDPSVILNSVCNEGWEVVNGSFVFIELGQESRDKFMASGQQVAVRGTVMGYYLFKRCEANKLQTRDPWEQ